MFNAILLFILKRRLKRYRRGARWYEKIGNYDNWYHEWGIPELEKQISAIENEIRSKKLTSPSREKHML